MRTLRSDRQSWRRARAWTSSPAFQIGVYVALLAMAPLIRLGVMQIFAWVESGGGGQ
jgi:hypothetical protein